MADPQQPTTAQAQEVLQQVQQTPAAPTAPVRIQTQTGQVFEGATQEEVLQKLVQSVENGTTRIKELSDRMSQLQPPQQQVQQPAPQPQAQKTFQEQYWELWQTDPIAADRFAAATRLGVPVEVVDQIERQAIHNAHQSAYKNSVDEFLARCPDYPNDDAQAAALMRGYLQQRFPGMQPNADMLEVAFNALVNSGQVKPLDVPTEDSELPTPPPRVGAGQVTVAPDFEAQFRALSTEQQAKALQELWNKGLR